MQYFSWLGIALLGLAYIAFTAFRGLRRPISNVPGPWYTRWTDAVNKYQTIVGAGAVYIHELHQKYGPIVRIGPNEVVVSAQQDVKALYATQEKFVKSPWYQGLSPAAVQNIFSTNIVDVHRRYRRLLGGSLSESALKHYLPQIEAKVNLAVERMRSEMQLRGATDIHKWWFFMATDVIGELSFGDSFRMLETGKKNQYSVDLQAISQIAGMRALFPTLTNLGTYLPLPLFSGFSSAITRVERYATESLKRYEALAHSNPTQVQQTLLSKVFKANQDDSLSFEEVTVNARSYIVAGSDTTSNTLTYLVWAVCSQTSIRDRLVNELKTLRDDYTDGDLRDLTYLNQVIMETLRVYSAAPALLPRIVPEGGATLGGHWLPADTQVGAQVYTVHRDPDVFPNPEAFNPSRWDETTQAMKDRFMPFSRGARNCIGLHLAEIELRLAVTKFFLAFPNATVSSLEGMSDEDMKPIVFFLQKPSGDRCLINAV